MKRVEEEFYSWSSQILNQLCSGGVLCTVADSNSNANVLTLGWGQIGPFYRGNPVFIIAITPLRYSWHFLEEVPEFVIGIPGCELSKAVAFCGTKSGRDIDKFRGLGLTPVDSKLVKPPSILECQVNIECRLYEKITPSHKITLLKSGMKAEDQHTVYFAEVLGTFRYQQ